MVGGPIVHEPNLPVHAPRALLDAGGELWATLSAAVGRLIDELAPGAVLEVISLEPSTRTEIPPWCGIAGHEMVRMLEDGDMTRFWIRKG